jgi:hypothetical protein
MRINKRENVSLEYSEGPRRQRPRFGSKNYVGSKEQLATLHIDTSEWEIMGCFFKKDLN